MYESYLQSLVLQSNGSQQGWKCKTAPFQKGGAQTKLFLGGVGGGNVQLWLMHVEVNIAAAVWNLLTAVSSLFQTLLQSRNWPRWLMMSVLMFFMMIIEDQCPLFWSIELNHHGVFQIVYAAVNHYSCLTRRPEPWALVTINPSTLFHRGQNHLHL